MVTRSDYGWTQSQTECCIVLALTELSSRPLPRENAQADAVESVFQSKFFVSISIMSRVAIRDLYQDPSLGSLHDGTRRFLPHRGICIITFRPTGRLKSIDIIGRG